MRITILKYKKNPLRWNNFQFQGYKIIITKINRCVKREFAPLDLTRYTFQMNLSKIASILESLMIDAYVIYDFRNSNYAARRVLQFQDPTTRRWVGIITKKGEFHLLIPKIEESLFSSLKATKHIFTTHEEYQELLSKLLKNFKTIAVDTSPQNDIPVLDIVPAGFIDLLKIVVPHAKIQSSATLTQYLTSVWGEEGLKHHKEAAKGLKESFDVAVETLRIARKEKKQLTDYDLEKIILDHYKKIGLEEEHGLAIVATNERASNPHYAPSEKENYKIEDNSLLLFDIWAKKSVPHSIYADITLMCWVGPDPIPQKVKEVWEVTRDARNKGVIFLEENKHREVKGFEVDDVVRKHIQDKGYGEYFVHRTGHSIDSNDHGSGANIDNFENHDERLLIADTGFSIEPGIYLPEFGVRSEIDVYLDEHKNPVVTTWKQEELVVIA